jgi:hypothetical protein
MPPNFDLTQFVGAASAPVALIIATSIFLSNLTTNWWSMSQIYRGLTSEYRSIDAFILTVVFTGLNILFPGKTWLMMLTIIFSFGGLMLLGASVIAEMMENSMGKIAMKLETEEYPELSEAAERIASRRIADA